MSEILVTGGNGFVGRHLVAAMQERGDSVRVLALPTEDAGWLEKRGVHVFRGDICRPETLAAPMEGVDATFHLAAMMDVWRPLADYHAVNVRGTENVCRAALAAGVGRVVHMSSSSVYGMAHGRPLDESSPLAPFDDPYPVTKAAGDEAVQRMIRDQRLPAVIVRPDQIFGPGDELHFGRIADRLLAGSGVVVGRGDNAMPLVYIADMVQGLLLALDHGRALGQAFNITNDRPLTQEQFLRAIARELGATPRLVHVPYRLLYAAGWAAEHFATLAPSSRRPPITRLGVAFAGSDSRYAIDKARHELGYVPRVDLNEAVRRTTRWYSDAAGAEAAVAAPASQPAEELAA